MKYLKLFVLSALLSASAANAGSVWRVVDAGKKQGGSIYGLGGPTYSMTNKSQLKSIQNLDFEFMDYFTPTIITKSVYDQLNNKFRGHLDLYEIAVDLVNIYKAAGFNNVAVVFSQKGEFGIYEKGLLNKQQSVGDVVRFGEYYAHKYGDSAVNELSQKTVMSIVSASPKIFEMCSYMKAAESAMRVQGFCKTK